MKIIRNSKQHLYGLSENQREHIKECLTFENPKYKSAKRYGRSKYISIPPYLMYYNEYTCRVGGEKQKVLSVPIGVNVDRILNVANLTIEDRRRVESVKYPKFLLDLRNDQIRAEEAYFKDIDCVANPKKSMIQLPTGKGKSILALHIAQRLGQRVCILVHKDDLVTGWKKDVELCFGGRADVGIFKAKSRKIGNHVTIATVQTLSRLEDYELENFMTNFGFVVQDECHHVGLNIFNIIDKFDCKYKLGLSATPKRSDGLDYVFDLFFGGLCYKHIVTEDDEDICGCEVRALYSNFKYKPFLHNGQVFNYYDFDPKELPDNLIFVSDMAHEDRPRIPFLNIDNEAVKSSLTKIKVCKKIIEHYKCGHSIIALFTQKEHINLYYRHLCRYIPKNQIMLYYGDSKEKSEDMMKKAESKEVLVTLATYAKATEGTNVKAWEVEFLVSSLNNEKNTEQATGRVRRRKEGKLDPVVIYDVRYDNCYSLSSHANTRMRVYRKLKYKVDDPRSDFRKRESMFSRGYKLT